MRIVNVVSLHFLKVILKKYYMFNNLDYVFIEQGDEFIETVKNTRPDIILLEEDPEFLNLNEMVEKINTLIGQDKKHRRIVVVHEPSVVSACANLDDPNLTCVSLDQLLIELPKLVFKITLALESERSTLLEIENQKSLLYVDDDGLVHALVEDAFKHTPYKLIHAKDGAEGYEKFLSEKPSLVITDLLMPKMTGNEMCRLIKSDPIGAQIPVIILTGSKEHGSIETAYNYGADDFIEKPLRPEALINKVNEYFQNRSLKRSEQILVVDDSRMIREVLRHSIMKSGMSVRCACDGVEALEMIAKEVPDVMITDINMPRMDGYELVRTIRETKGIEDMKILMISTNSSPYDIKRGNALGIARYFVKPFDVDKVIMEVEHHLLEKYKIYKKEYEYMLYSISSLVQALEERDPYTKGHTDRVTDYSVKLATFMQLDQKEIEKIRIAATLHDIGKIGIRDDILLKTGHLDSNEYLRIQEHTIKGVEILKPIQSLKEVLPLILLHHERWDGEGYPTAIKGNDIPIGARIISVADAYDAMTSNRPYREHLTQEDALKDIQLKSGSQFCPICATAFCNMIKLLENETL